MISLKNIPNLIFLIIFLLFDGFRPPFSVCFSFWLIFLLNQHFFKTNGWEILLVRNCNQRCQNWAESMSDWPKCTEIWSEKVLDLSNFVSIRTHFGPKSGHSFFFFFTMRIIIWTLQERPADQWDSDQSTVSPSQWRHFYCLCLQGCQVEDLVCYSKSLFQSQRKMRFLKMYLIVLSQNFYVC